MTYRDHPSLSQSTLSNISRGDYFPSKSGGATHFTLGSMVDCLLTTPDEFDLRYLCLPKTAIPSGQLKIWVDNYDLEDEERFALTKSKSKSDEKILKFKEEEKEFAQYVGAIQSGLIVVSPEEEELSRRIYESLTDHPHTKFWAQEPEAYPDHIECLSQLEVYFDLDIDGRITECKALLDRVLIDHFEKVIYPIDFKTTRHRTSSFEEAILDWRYDFQAAFYTEALEHWATEKGYDDYRIHNFLFVVESKTVQGCPLVYEMSETDIQHAWIGGEVDGKYYKGLIECIELYNWHKETGSLYSKEIADNKGYLKTNIYGREL